MTTTKKPKTTSELKIERYEKMYNFLAKQFQPGMLIWIQACEPITEREIIRAETALDKVWESSNLKAFNEKINTIYKLFLKGFSAYKMAKNPKKQKV